MKAMGEVRRAVAKASASIVFLMMVLGAAALPAAAQSYTVNGEQVDYQTQQMFYLAGFPPGAYYLDQQGNFGMVGQPPIMNLYEMQAQMGQQQTYPQGQNPYGAYGGQPGGFSNTPGDPTGSRIFWVYSPSMFSGARGGSSGYIHICPGGVYYRSSEGSISIGGEYRPYMDSDPENTGMNDSWAGMASTSQNAGQWTMQQGEQGPEVVLYNSDGSTQQFPISTLQQGSWTWGQTRYAVESGSASCR